MNFVLDLFILFASGLNPIGRKTRTWQGNGITQWTPGGCLKVSDFGLSAPPQQVREDGLLHTTCGTPNYVAPEIHKADFSCPPWFSSSAKKLIKRILDPNPVTRITTAEVIENEWFKKGYVPPRFEQENVSLAYVDAIFNEAGDSPILVVERRDERPTAPVTMNAFELISKYQGLNLSSLFEKQMEHICTRMRGHVQCSY